jgi:hypothetical protein
MLNTAIAIREQSFYNLAVHGLRSVHGYGHDDGTCLSVPTRFRV